MTIQSGINIPNVLDDPPPLHYKLLGHGERPYWTPDGERIAFIESNYGDACEIALETRKVRDLTKGLGKHHSFLRVLVLSNGDYLLIGPKEFKDRDISRRVESELWVLDKNCKTPPKPLGRRIFEGCGVSTLAPRIAYGVTGRNDPSLGRPDIYECHVTEIVYGSDGPELGQDRVFYRASGVARPEPQDFRHDDTEVIMAEYIGNRKEDPENWKCVVKGVKIETSEVRTYIDEPQVHNECEGIFPDHENICLASTCDGSPQPLDFYKLKLDGSGRRVRMSQFNSPLWRATNPNVSPDGKWVAFMVTLRTDESGYGRGLGLLDLEAWEKTPEAQQWGTPSSH